MFLYSSLPLIGLRDYLQKRNAVANEVAIPKSSHPLPRSCPYTVTTLSRPTPGSPKEIKSALCPRFKQEEALPKRSANQQGARQRNDPLKIANHCPCSVSA